MPPKRKAAAAPSGAAPPSKRRLRSAKEPLQDTELAEAPPKTRARRQTRAKVKPNNVAEPETKTATPEDAPPPKRGRGRPPTRVSAMKARSVPKKVVDQEPPEPSSSRVTLEDTSRPLNVPESESDDELLLSPPKKSKPSSPPVTPPPRRVTPRREGQFMEAVEIRTPSWLVKPSTPRLSAVNSPGPSSPKKRPARKARASTPPPSLPQQSVTHTSPDRKSTRLNSSHSGESRMPSSA